MTDREKAIVMAYTGVCMLSGYKVPKFYKYVEAIMGRPVYTHELADKIVADEIKEKAKADFISLCAEQKHIDKSAMLLELYMKGVNMTGEYQGCWVRFKDIEKIVNKYMTGSEEEE